jgi:hypothetical protein
MRINSTIRRYWRIVLILIMAVSITIMIFKIRDLQYRNTYLVTKWKACEDALKEAREGCHFNM